MDINRELIDMYTWLPLEGIIDTLPFHSIIVVQTDVAFPFVKNKRKMGSDHVLRLRFIIFILWDRIYCIYASVSSKLSKREHFLGGVL
jgi:hypothetical protein